jgi:hypothetical protein
LRVALTRCHKRRESNNKLHCTSDAVGILS